MFLSLSLQGCTAVTTFWVSLMTALSFQVFSFPFWLLLTVCFLFAMAIVESDHEVLAFIPFGIFAFIVHNLGGIDVVHFLKDNVKEIVYIAATYYAIGGTISILAFIIKIRLMSNEHAEAKEEFFKNNKDAKEEDWLEYIYENNRFDANPATIYKHFHFYPWIMWWPTKIIWVAISDWIHRLREIVYSFSRKALQAINTVVGGSMVKDYERARAQHELKKKEKNTKGLDEHLSLP